MIRRLIDFLDQEEAPTTLAVLRIAVAAVMLWDLATLYRHDLVVPLFAPEAAGGLSIVLARDEVPLLYQWAAPTAGTARALFGTMVASAGLLFVGAYTRTTALVLLLTSAQSALITPFHDRGIDMLLRNVLFLLVFSGAGRTLSVDAVARTGSVLGDRRPVPAWPRYLVVLQVLGVHLTGGVEQWFWTPLMVLFLYYRATRERPGRLRWLCNRYLAVAGWLVVGVAYHVLTQPTQMPGMLPFAMLAIYVAFVPPDAWRKAGQSTGFWGT